MLGIRSYMTSTWTWASPQPSLIKISIASLYENTPQKPYLQTSLKIRLNAALWHLCTVLASFHFCTFMIPLTVFSPIIAGVCWGLGSPLTCLKLDIWWRGEWGFKGRPYYNFAFIYFSVVFCCILLSNWNSGTGNLSPQKSDFFEIPCLMLVFLGHSEVIQTDMKLVIPLPQPPPNTRIMDTPTSPVGQFISFLSVRFFINHRSVRCHKVSVVPKPTVMGHP